MTPPTSDRAARQHYVSSSDRRAQIALAARAIIAENGFEGLRMRDIANRLGINIATLHYHVTSKDSLIELVAESMRADFEKRHNARPRDGMSGAQQLLMMIEDFGAAHRETPDIYIVIRDLSNRAGRDSAVAAVIMPMVVGWHERIAGILEAGCADGSLCNAIDPEAGALIVAGALTDYTCCPETSPGAFESLSRQLMRCFKAE